MISPPGDGRALVAGAGDSARRPPPPLAAAAVVVVVTAAARCDEQHQRRAWARASAMRCAPRESCEPPYPPVPFGARATVSSDACALGIDSTCDRGHRRSVEAATYGSAVALSTRTIRSSSQDLTRCDVDVASPIGPATVVGVEPHGGPDELLRLGRCRTRSGSSSAGVGARRRPSRSQTSNAHSGAPSRPCTTEYAATVASPSCSATTGTGPLVGAPAAGASGGRSGARRRRVDAEDVLGHVHADAAHDARTRRVGAQRRRPSSRSRARGTRCPGRRDTAVRR